MAITPLAKTVQLFALLIFSVIILYYAKSVLVPLTFGAVLAMLLIPVCRWLQRRGIPLGIASVLCVLLLLALVAGLVLLLQWQIGDLVKDMSKVETQVQDLLTKLQTYASQKFGISAQQQQQMIDKNKTGGAGKIAGFAASVLGSFGGFLVNTILALIYTFLFIYFRRHFKNFVLKVAGNENKPAALKILTDGSKVTQEYISGLGIMIVMLWVMYGIGFSIVGIKGAIFFAILCGTLEIIPFAGNITGTTITVLVAAAQSGSINTVLGVLITYGLVQFIQSYILQPLIVGKQIDIHPLFTILIIVVGEAVWGIPGMVLSLPLLGIFKVICDNVEPLKTYGYLIGSGKNE